MKYPCNGCQNAHLCREDPLEVCDDYILYSCVENARMPGESSVYLCKYCGEITAVLVCDIEYKDNEKQIKSGNEVPLCETCYKAYQFGHAEGSKKTIVPVNEWNSSKRDSNVPLTNNKEVI